MAGEIEDHISFQAGSLHSGSISFGRFEAESLSWERRSSFSHNRYLEEVEKYSTPGSVTQKKAYFEAHFKKKALLRQASECQTGIEYQTSDNDILDHMSYMEEFEHANEGGHFAHYDESTDGSDDHGECEVMECERKGEEISPSEFQMEPTVVNTEFEHDLQHVDPSEIHQTQFECESQMLVKNEPEVEVKQKLDDEAENVDGLPKTSNPSPKSLTTGKDDAPSMKKSQKTSLKVIATTETRSTKPRVRTQVTGGQVPKKISSETSKDSVRNSRRMERESSLRIETEKQSLEKFPPTTCSLPNTLKPEDPRNWKAKPSQENISQKDVRAKRAGTTPPPFASDKGESKSRQTANRPKRTVNSTKPDIKPSGAVFSFKSHERAEKRKEFYMKLEEKMHAKEVEMNQIQARTQEETEAAIKQFRRSLNFKATPMPSFYHEAMPRGSDGKKATSPHAKSTKLQSKSTSPGCRAAAGSPAFSQSGYQHNLPVNESASIIDQPQMSEATNCPTAAHSEADSSSPTPSTNKNRTLQAEKRIGMAGKKEREKGKDACVLKQQGSENSKVKKGERVEGRGVVGGIGRNSSSEMMRKMMKGVAVGGSPGMGRLSVDVAS